MPHSNLSDRACEPLSSGQEPASNRKDEYDSHGNDGIVEGLSINGIRSRETKDDGDEHNPQNGYKANGSGHDSKAERTFGVAVGVDERDKDWNTVREVKTNCGYGGCGSEGDGRTKGGKGEEEG